MNRRRFLHDASAAGAAIIGAPALTRLGRADYDIVLRGGTVIDGIGRAGIKADVAIIGSRIARIAPRIAERGKREIDCAGHVVSPGFVDIHTHVDGTLFDDPLMESVIRQGVTTTVVGADGGSDRRVGEFLRRVATLRPAANIATLVGLGTVRGEVVGADDRPASSAELRAMTRLVETALAEGAVGASSGLEYTPGGFATRAELIALCRPVAARGLAYHTHMRNEDDRLVEAVEEAIAVAQGARCGLQVSHLKTQGPRNWGKLDTVFARFAAARATGIDAAFDRYPYVAYQTGLTNLFPLWSRDGGTERFFARLDDPALAGRIETETRAKVDLIGGWDNVQVTSVAAAADKGAEGQRLGAHAVSRQEEPYALCVAMLRRSRGSVGMVGFAMSEENLERILAHEWGMVASDGGAWAASGPARRGVPHPRGTGSFARVLGRYVRERNVMTLEQGVRKLSALPASRVRLAGRGTLAAGSFADVAVFDPETVNDRATFADPFAYATGVKATIVNGSVAFLDGERGERSGRALRRR